MLLALVFIPLAAAALAVAMPSNRLRPWIVPSAALAHLAVTASVLGHAHEKPVGRWLAIDPLNRLFLGFVSLLFFLCALYIPSYLRLRSERDNRVFCACSSLGLGMMTLVMLSHHLGLMWVAMEATTLATAPSIYFNHNPRSLEATWKYLMLGSVGIAIALLGSFFLAYSMVQAGLPPTLMLDELVRHPHALSAPWLHSAFVLLLIGYGTKMGLAPMHTWKPDAYGEAPGVVGAVLAGGMTSCAFLCVLRFFHVSRVNLDELHPRSLLIFMGLASMATAAVFVSRQRDLKRLLAYSSVEHMGMLVFGVGLGGAAFGGSLLHMVHNGLCKALMFLSVGNIHRAYGSKSTDRVRGILERLPWSGSMFLMGFFAITGAPLFGPFVSEYQIVSGAFATGHTTLGLVFLGLLLLVFWGMGATIFDCSFGPAEPRATPPSSNVEEQRGPSPSTQRFEDSFGMVAPIVLFMGLTVFLGLRTPEFLQRWVEEAVAYVASTGP